MNIGILYPRSKAHSGLLPDFMDGIKASLKQELSEGTMQLFSESIGFGAAEHGVRGRGRNVAQLGIGRPWRALNRRAGGDVAAVWLFRASRLR